MHSESIADVIELKDTEGLSSIGHGFFSLFFYGRPPSPSSSELARDLLKSILARILR